MKTIYDVIIIGSGPAGVSAAWPLVKGGMNVLMLDGGEIAQSKIPTDTMVQNLELMRKTSDKRLLGNNFIGLNDDQLGSPKLRLSGFRQSIYLKYNSISTKNFNLVGAIGAGGLSNIWGGACSFWDDDDLDGTLLNAEDLRHSYIEVSQRIGLSGKNDYASKVPDGIIDLQNPVRLTPKSQFLLEKYQKYTGIKNILLGHTLNAVRTRDIEAQLGCNGCMACMWGCDRYSIYSSKYDLSNLQKFPNFSIRGRTVAKKIIQAQDDSWNIACVVNGEDALTYIEGRQVVLALGSFASTSIYMRSFGNLESRLRAFSNPALSAAVISPGFFGKGLPKIGFGGAQLSFKIPFKNGSKADYAYGLIFDAASLPAYDLMKHMPFTAKGSMRIVRELLPTMSILLVYFPARLSNYHVELTNIDSVTVDGGLCKEYYALEKFVKNEIKAFYQKLESFVLPGSIKRHAPGSEVHYGGMLGANGILDIYGEVKGHKGLYVVDGAALPVLPAKSHTLTIMANADRIAKNIFLKWSNHN